MTSVVEADGTIIIIPDPEEDAFAQDGASLRLARGSASYAAGLEPDDGEGWVTPRSQALPRGLRTRRLRAWKHE